MSLFVPLDVTFPDDPKIIEAGLDGAGLFAMAMCRAKHLLSDGVLTRSQLYRIGGTDEVIDRLVGLGLFEECGAHAVRIAAWWKRHAPASEVLDSEKAGELAHKRWHVGRGERKKDCRWCFPQVNADVCDAGDASASASAMPESESETKPETTDFSSSPTGRDPRDPTSDDGLDELVIAVATARGVRLGRSHRNWIIPVAHSLDTNRCRQLANRGLNPAEIDVALDKPADEPESHATAPRLPDATDVVIATPPSEHTHEHAAAARAALQGHQGDAA